MTEGSFATLAFSTLACPEWDAETVIQRAVTYGFDGVEWRAGPDGTVRVDWNAPRRAAVRTALADSGIMPVAVTAYPELLSADPALRAASVDDLVRHADLAIDLGAPTVRVFLGIADDDAPAAELERRAVDALAEALTRTDPRVTLAIEPHDDHVRAEAVTPILAALPDARLGIVWDIANAWVAGESPQTGMAAYAERIAYVQVKDGTGRGASWRLTALGAGEVPLAEALEGLRAVPRLGSRALPPISVEWERAWHPDLAPPEEALPAARRWLEVALAGIGADGPGGRQPAGRTT